MAIEIKNIKKKFKNNLVLDGIDLTIEKGDVIGIIGPSGTGKSTLLRSINRLVKPESGSIVLSDGNEIDLVTAKEKDLLTLNQFTGMVFQNFNLFNWKTALENVMEGLLVVKKMDKEQARETALKRLADVGLLTGKTIIQSIYPVDSSSVWQLREHLQCSRNCYCWMSNVRIGSRICGGSIGYYKERNKRRIYYAVSIP
mgnify:CR=1 FL=1